MSLDVFAGFAYKPIVCRMRDQGFDDSLEEKITIRSKQTTESYRPFKRGIQRIFDKTDSVASRT